MVNKTLSFKNEFYRKLIHLSSLIFPFLYYFYDFVFFIYLLALLTIITLILNVNYNFLLKFLPKIFNINFVIRKNEYKSLWSASFMMIAFFVVSLFFDKSIVITSMVITSISDPIAGLFGMKFGKLKLFHNKTLEGSYAFLISTFIIILISFNSINIFLLIICFIITLTELSTPMKYDNVSIPLVSSFFLTLHSIL